MILSRAVIRSSKFLIVKILQAIHVGAKYVADKETVVWGIHAGKTGAADDLFLRKNYVALGWSKMGDLSKLKADREAFKAKVVECWPDWKEGRIRNSAGQLFRFVYEMKAGDFVLYPSKQAREVHIGRVEGPYKYDPNLEPGYPNLRPVTWLRFFPRTHFSQGALYVVWYGVKSALSAAGGRHLLHFDNFASLLLTVSFGFAMEHSSMQSS